MKMTNWYMRDQWKCHYNQIIIKKKFENGSLIYERSVELYL